MTNLVHEHGATLHFVVGKSVPNPWISSKRNECVCDNSQWLSVFDKAIGEPKMVGRKTSEIIHDLASCGEERPLSEELPDWNIARANLRRRQ
jgi:hypothetical protein